MRPFFQISALAQRGYQSPLSYLALVRPESGCRQGSHMRPRPLGPSPPIERV